MLPHIELHQNNLANANLQKTKAEFEKGLGIYYGKQTHPHQPNWRLNNYLTPQKSEVDSTTQSMFHGLIAIEFKKIYIGNNGNKKPFDMRLHGVAVKPAKRCRRMEPGSNKL